MKKTSEAPRPMPLFILIASAVLILAFAGMSIWILLADPSESCQAEEIKEWRGYFPVCCSVLILLFTLSAKNTRISPYSMLSGSALLIAFQYILFRMICGHESYGMLPLVWLLCTILWCVMSLIHLGTHE